MTNTDRPRALARRRPWWTWPAMVVAAASIFSFLDAPYADVAPGPTPELTAAVAAQNAGGDIDPTFGHGGRWHVTTINATPLSWGELALCKVRGGCRVFPLASGSDSRARANVAMDESVSEAATMARTWAGGSGDHDVTMDADLGPVGGPSAGLMLTLAFIDAATDGDLTGGRVIAGTGTMNSLAEVGPVSGVEFKVAGAAKAGADIFLAPALEADEARKAARGLDIQVVPASHLPDAIAWLCDNGGQSPVCQSPALASALEQQAELDALSGR